jgi:hypothetical protein
MGSKGDFKEYCIYCKAKSLFFSAICATFNFKLSGTYCKANPLFSTALNTIFLYFFLFNLMLSASNTTS